MPKIAKFRVQKLKNFAQNQKKYSTSSKTNKKLSSVIPTVNEYLMSLGADQEYLGVVISMFAVGSIISAPLMGRLADKIGTSRPLVMIGICCHLIGAVVTFG